MNYKRCAWVPGGDALYRDYHDCEWGVPVYDDQQLFEFLILESFQAGLSWRTILHKRDNFRKAFAGFDVLKVAQFDERDEQRLLQDAGIVRNRLKIKAAIQNARAFIEIQNSFSTFSEYIWQFTDGRPLLNHWKHISEIPATTNLSDTISKDLKTRGFKFVGSTVIYAHMQATGMVNDHTTDCFRHSEVQAG